MTYTTMPDTSANADNAIQVEATRQQTGAAPNPQNSFYNELNFWLNSTGPVAYEYLARTDDQPEANVLGAVVSGTNAGATDMNAVYNPYGTSGMGAYGGGYGYPPYGVPQPYAPYYAPTTTYPYAAPYTGMPATSPYVPYTGTGASTTTGLMTTGSSAKTTTSAQTTGPTARTTTGAMTGVVAAPTFAASTLPGAGNNSDLLNQISQVTQSSMQMMEMQFVMGQEVVRLNMMSNILKNRHDADIAVVRNMKVS